MSDITPPWSRPMPEGQFELIRDILDAPSPVGLEVAMTYGVLEPYFQRFAPEAWCLHQLKGHAGVVLDTLPGLDRAGSLGHQGAEKPAQDAE